MRILTGLFYFNDYEEELNYKLKTYLFTYICVLLLVYIIIYFIADCDVGYIILVH